MTISKRAGSFSSLYSTYGHRCKMISHLSVFDVRSSDHDDDVRDISADPALAIIASKHRPRVRRAFAQYFHGHWYMGRITRRWIEFNDGDELTLCTALHHCAPALSACCNVRRFHSIRLMFGDHRERGNGGSSLEVARARWSSRGESMWCPGGARGSKTSMNIGTMVQVCSVKKVSRYSGTTTHCTPRTPTTPPHYPSHTIPLGAYMRCFETVPISFARNHFS